MRPDIRPRNRNAPRPAHKSAPQFLQWLRGRQCLFTGMGACEGKIEAVHLDFAGDKGMATKVSDRFCVPGCSGHHGRQHRIGWGTFLREVGLNRNDLLSAADYLWSRWPGRPDWERKQ